MVTSFAKSVLRYARRAWGAYLKIALYCGISSIAGTSLLIDSLDIGQGLEIKIVENIATELDWQLR
jgi:hypothetical protein